MTGIIDVGGGLRGIYGAGVFDGLLDAGIHLDCCVGVSAGSANAVSYITRQYGRNYRFFSDYTFRKEYMSLSNFAKTGSYINFQYIYGTLSNSGGEDPVDYDALTKYDGIFKVVATDADSGRTVYFDKTDITRDNYRVFSASCCIPVVNRPVEIGGRNYFDGGVSLPVPLDYTLDTLGCDKVIVILTLPKYYIKPDGIDARSGLLLKKYPVIADLLVTRAARYNRQVSRAILLENEGKVLIVAPDDTCGINTLTKDRDGLDRLYEKGLAAAPAIEKFLNT